MEKFTNFLKKSWWIWLILLAISSLFLIFGASAIGSFLINVVRYCFIAGLFFWIWAHTFGREQTGWGIYRISGLIGFCFFTLILIVGPFNLFENNIRVAIKNPLFNFASFGLIFSLLIFVIGEIFLYLDKIQSSIKSIEDSTTQQKKESENMTCPRCFGKGFVDLNDIKRLGMENTWRQDYCRYCDGQGKVEKGKTMVLDPLSDYI
jgi:hypothetical protein